MPTDSEVSMKRIVWRGLNGASREVCSVELDADSLVARGHVDVGAAACAYQLKASTDGTSTELELQVSDREVVARLSDGEWVVDGVARPDLAAAREVDISATPLTNTLPIRRLRLAVGDAADIITAYISVPELAVSPHPQRYTRIGLVSISTSHAILTSDAWSRWTTMELCSTTRACLLAKERCRVRTKSRTTESARAPQMIGSARTEAQHRRAVAQESE